MGGVETIHDTRERVAEPTTAWEVLGFKDSVWCIYGRLYS